MPPYASIIDIAVYKAYPNGLNFHLFLSYSKELILIVLNIHTNFSQHSDICYINWLVYVLFGKQLFNFKIFIISSHLYSYLPEITIFYY